MNTVIGVGGTGQLVIHHLLQLYLIGHIQSPFKALVVDTAPILPSIKKANDFLGLVTYAVNPSRPAGEEELARIDSVRVHNTRDAENAVELLTGDEKLDEHIGHPCQALFARNTLLQSLSEGLFARPALSSLLSLGALSREKLEPRGSGTVVVVGSILGGTGSGLMPRILEEVDKFPGVSSTRAVFFAEYFKPDSNKIDPRLFQSNQCWVLRSMAESMPSISNYAIVGGPSASAIKRETLEEEKTWHLDWPTANHHPYWQGTGGVIELWGDKVPDKREGFAEREYKLTTPLDRGRADTKLRHSLALLGTLVGQRVLSRMAREPFLAQVWGDRLPMLLERFWKIARQVDTGTPDLRVFADLVQKSLEEQWKIESYPLAALFPRKATQRYKPRVIRKTAWPDWNDTFHAPFFENAGSTAKRAAAGLIFAALRNSPR